MDKMSFKEFKKQAKKPAQITDDFMKSLTILGGHCKVGVVPEYKFHPSRKWRFDFAWPDKMVAVECDGMVWQAGGGRHNTDADREKINTAVSMGWRVLRFSGKQVRNDPTGCLDLLSHTLCIDDIRDAIKSYDFKTKHSVE